MRDFAWTGVAMVGVLAAGAAWAQSGNAGADARFVDQATTSGRAEIAAGQVAESHGSVPVRLFGHWMVTDHTLVNQLLQAEAQRAGISVPAPGPQAQAAAAATGQEHDRAFDQKYLTQQVADHQRAVTLFEQEAASGQDAGLKQLAADVLPAVREHLAAARDLLNRPAETPGTQVSLPNPNAPPATPSTTTGSTAQPPQVKQMNQQALQKVQTEGK